MGKIVCEVCGTSYSDTASQCPICGFAHRMDTQIVTEDPELLSYESKYQHVKGGRFSKANVKKRNMGKTYETHAVEEVEEETVPASGHKNRGLVITVLVLLVAIILVVAYLVVILFFPQLFNLGSTYESVDELSNSATLELVPCTQIDIEYSQIFLEGIGESVMLSAKPFPENTTDSLIFTSADPSVVLVDQAGRITAVSGGETSVNVTCGNISFVCIVTVTEPAPMLSFTTESISFAQPEESLVIYVGDIPVEEIFWHSDDSAVAVISNGEVIAVGSGVTTVYGTYEDVTVSCTVSCDFAAIEETEPTEPTEPPEDNGPYSLKNPVGYSSSDVSIRVGDSFTLILVDRFGDKVNNATWTITDGSSCSVDNGTITGIEAGNCSVNASYGGETHSCIVRVS